VLSTKIALIPSVSVTDAACSIEFQLTLKASPIDRSAVKAIATLGRVLYQKQLRFHRLTSAGTEKKRERLCIRAYVGVSAKWSGISGNVLFARHGQRVAIVHVNVVQ
jgi:hypothetical protein